MALLIARLMHLKKIRESTLQQLAELRTRYMACPDAFLNPLQNYLLEKEESNT